jgi:uncharacterized Zn-finger protein
LKTSEVSPATPHSSAFFRILPEIWYPSPKSFMQKRVLLAHLIYKSINYHENSTRYTNYSPGYAYCRLSSFGNSFPGASDKISPKSIVLSPKSKPEFLYFGLKTNIRR